MKTYILSLLFLLCFGVYAFAQDELKDNSAENRFSVAVQMGTDIGGAVPFPFKHTPSTFNPYPKLNLSLGGKVTVPLDKNWALGGEITYKTVAISADARVKNQRFKENEHIQYFTGSAEMDMEFTMVEFPLYAKYTFKNGKDRILLGPYAAWILNSSFVTDPQKGFIGMEENVVEAEMPEDMEDMDFSHSLDSWDAGVVVGYERQIYSRFELGIRFMWGFKDIFKSDNQYFDYKMLHMRGVFVLSYNLFNIKSK